MTVPTPGSITARAPAVLSRHPLLLGSAALFALRVALSLVRTGPLLVADEVGYLTNARVLAGGVAGQMTTAPFYRGGYSLVLAPVVALLDDPEAGYRVALVVNALLAASLAPLLYLMLTRTFRVSAERAVWPALAAAAYPSVTIFTQATLSENLLLPLAVGWLVCVGALVDAAPRRRPAWAAATAVCAVWLWAAHGRMIVAPVITAAAFLVLAAARRGYMRAALLGVAVLAAGAVGVHELNAFLISRSWDGHAPDEVARRLSTIESAGGVAAFLRNLVGMSWYLVVASLGTVVAAAASLLPRLRRPRTQDAVLAVALAACLGLLVESALSFRDLDRPDMLIYGRYAEVLLPPLIAVALVSLAGGRGRLLGALGTIAVGTVAAAALRARVSSPGVANRWNVASLPSPTFGLQAPVLVAAGLAATVAIAALLLVARRAPTAVAPLALLLFLPTTAVAEREPVLSAQHSFYPAGWTSPAPAAGTAAAVAFENKYSDALWVYQWFLPHSKLLLVTPASATVPSRLVIATPDWAARHTRLRPRVLWRDESRGRALFSVARRR